MTGAELEQGITALCTLPENGALTLSQASRVFGAKISGATPETIEAILASFRELNSYAK